MTTTDSSEPAVATSSTPVPDAGRDVSERTFRIWVGVAMALGFSIRVAFVIIKQSRLTLTTGDAFWYHMQARLVADGRGFLNPFLLQNQGIAGPGADHPPGLVLILTAADLLGIDTPQGQRILMSVLGTASILLIALLGRRIGSRKVGIVAALLAATYPNIWINDGMLMVETVYILVIAASLLATYRYLDRHRLGDLVVLSSALAAAAMLRPESLVLFAVMVTPMVLSRTTLSWPRRCMHLAVAALIPILAFAPWVIYNLGRFESPVTISTGAGQTLAAGNCDITYSGDKIGYYDLGCIDDRWTGDPTGDPTERDAALQADAREYMSAHRSELPKVMLARVARVWHLYGAEQSLTLDGWIEGRAGGPPSGDRSLVTVALLSYFALVPLALVGGFLTWRRGVRIWPLLVQPALVTVVAAITFGITRYRAGAEITLVVLAAVTICAVHHWVTTRLVGVHQRNGRAAEEATASQEERV